MGGLPAENVEVLNDFIALSEAHRNEQIATSSQFASLPELPERNAARVALLRLL